MSDTLQLGALPITSSQVQYVEKKNGMLFIHLGAPYSTVIQLERKSEEAIAFLVWLYPQVEKTCE